MNTNAALIVPPQATNTNAAAHLMYHDNAKPLIAISDVWFWVGLGVASLADFLSQCDLIKFAKYEPTEVELRKLHEAAVRLVNETEPREVFDAGSASQAQPAEAGTTN